MSTIRFELRADKQDKDGFSPIRIVYQQHAQRRYIATRHRLPAANWNTKAQEATYVKKGAILEQEVREINSSLADLKRQIEKIENRFMSNELQFGIDEVVDELKSGKTALTKRDASSKELYAFIEKYIHDHSNKRVNGSLSVYRSMQAHLKGYEKTKGVKVAFDKINIQFFNGFENYLYGLKVTEKDETVKSRLNSITVAKVLSTLKTFLNYARQSGIKVADNYQSARIERQTDLEIIALSYDEYKKILHLDLTAQPSLARVRDVFCFSCCTGLRYSDLLQLKREHIENEYLNFRAKKTDRINKVPLNPDAKAILKRYEHEPNTLPVISNQKSNKYLEKVCQLAGLDKKIEISRKHGNKVEKTVYKKYELIRMHAGRKTFATVSAALGMRAETIMKIGGWRSYSSFKRYLDVSDERTLEEMKLVYSNPSKEKLKAI